jgi:hypothetical protein
MSFYLLKKEKYLDFGLCVLFGMLLMFIIQSMTNGKGGKKRILKTHLSSVRSYLSKLSDSIKNKFRGKNMKKHRDERVKSRNSIPRVVSVSKKSSGSLSVEVNRDNELDNYYRSYLSKLSESIRDKVKAKHMRKHKNKRVKAHNSNRKVLSVSKNNAMTLSEEPNRDNELDDYYRLYTPTISSNRY